MIQIEIDLFTLHKAQVEGGSTSRPGLVKKKVTVKRGGKTFQQYRWVKAGAEEPKDEKPSVEEPTEKKPKGPAIIGLNKPTPDIGMSEVPKVEGELEDEGELTEENMVNLKGGDIITVFGMAQRINGIDVESKKVFMSGGGVKLSFSDIIGGKGVFGEILPDWKLYANKRNAGKVGAESPCKELMTMDIKVGDYIEVGEDPEYTREMEVDAYDDTTGIVEFEDGSDFHITDLIAMKMANNPLVSGDPPTGDYVFTQKKGYDKKISATINILDTRMLAGESIQDAVISIVGSGKSKNFNFSIKKGMKNSSEVSKTMGNLNKFISDKYADKLDINVEETETGRAHAKLDQGTICVSGYVGSDINGDVFHEAGHLVENVEANQEVALGFFKSRTGAGEDAKKLSDIFPRNSYRDDEVVTVDDFYNPYCGKHYKKGDGKFATTEIISMGLQRMSNEEDMRKFYIQDKEHFAVTLAVMAGAFL